MTSSYNCFLIVQHTTFGDITVRVYLIGQRVQFDTDANSTGKRMSPQNMYRSQRTMLPPASEIKMGHVVDGKTYCTARFEVWDTGSGLSGVDPTKFFEPFSQGNSGLIVLSERFFYGLLV